MLMTIRLSTRRYAVSGRLQSYIGPRQGTYQGLYRLVI